MARYFAGNSMAHFDRTTTDIVETTVAGRFDPAFVTSAIIIAGSNPEFIQTTPFVATGTVWLRYDWLLTTTSGSTGNAITFMNGSVNVFRMVRISVTQLQCSFWNGSAWVVTGGIIDYFAGLLHTMTFKVNLNSGFEAYIGDILQTSGTGWSGGGTTVTHVTIECPTSAGQAYVSQVLIADYNIINSHYNFSAIDGNSLVNTGGVGTFTDVNETVVNDATMINVATVGNKMGQTKAAITVPTGYRIGAMVISARGRATGGTVVDGKLGIRTAGGVNNSGSALGYPGNYSARQRIIDNDPDTGVPFLQAGFNGAQIYEEAA